MANIIFKIQKALKPLKIQGLQAANNIDIEINYFFQLKSSF